MRSPAWPPSTWPRRSPPTPTSWSSCGSPTRSARPPTPSVDRWSLVANDLARQGALQGRLRAALGGRPVARFRRAVRRLRRDRRRLRARRRRRFRPGTYNLGSGRPATVLELAGLVQDAFADRTGERPAARMLPPPRPIRRARTTSRCAGLAAHGIGTRALAARGGAGDGRLLPGEPRGALIRVSEIHDVRVTPLRRIPDERGAILHMLRATPRGSSASARSTSRWSTPGWSRAGTSTGG